MKSIKILLIALIIGFTPFLVSAQTSGSEQINDYQVKIVINSDSSFDVTETIVYDFGTNDRHGIYRDIPVKYSSGVNNLKLRISNISVSNDGQAEPFSKSNPGSNLELKIGSPDFTITGPHTYRISYHVVRGLNYFSDHDELYWNVVGNDWQVPILKSETTVTTPAGISNLQTQCYVGAFGSKDANCTNQSAGNSASFSTALLNPGQAATIVIGWPKGFTAQPSTTQRLIYVLQDNLIYFLPIIVFLIMFWLWSHYGKDPKSALPVVAQYEAPDDLTPAEVGYMHSEKFANGHISAEVIYLATQGYLKIERIPKQGMFGNDDYKLIKLKSEADIANLFEKNLMMQLFSSGDETLLSYIKNHPSTAPSLMSGNKKFMTGLIPKGLVAKGYYTKDPTAVRAKYIGSAAVMGGLFVYLFAQFFSGAAIFSILASLVMIVGFGYFMPRRTPKGADIKQLVEGLKLYIGVAEKDRLDFHNDPAKDPQIFEKLLPYAIALGLSEQWAKKFEGLFDYHPGWYSDPSMRAFSFVYFNSSLNRFNSSFAAATTANRSAAARGNSGFGGGGFSGGGFGGGGGGSW